ncbi:rCG43431, isoform CRA_a, partial [Rattus norvegicus]
MEPCSGSLLGSYLHSCSMWGSFSRGLSIHRTWGLKVENNIFYKIVGHALLVGSYMDRSFSTSEAVIGRKNGWWEEGSMIRNNVIINVSGAEGLSSSEMLAPAGIYTFSPTSAIEGNRVCAAGYGYVLHLVTSQTVQAPLLSFNWNTAHSCTRYGLLVYPEFQPPWNNDTGFTLFQNFMVWGSAGGAQIFRSNNLHLRNFQVYACRDFGIDILESDTNTLVTDSFLLGHFTHEGSLCMSVGIKTPKRWGLTISNTTFVNFDLNCVAIRTCSGCSQGQVSGEGQVHVFLQVKHGAPPTVSASTSVSESALKWSLPETWQDVEKGWGGYNHTIPGPGDDVLILPMLFVFLSGTLENPLGKDQRLLILLRASEEIFCDRFDGIRVDPGTIGVYGKLRLHSAYPKKSWVHLGADIAPGNERNASSLITGNQIYTRPSVVSILVQPSDGEVGIELPIQPRLIFLDEKNERVEALGLPSEPWIISVSLEGTSESMLKGCTQAETQDGYVTFSRLAVLTSGSNWHLVFTVTFPPEIKPEDISESQAKEQKKNTHISSKPRELQVKTAKEDAMMGE